MDTGPEELRLAREVLHNLQITISKNEGDEEFRRKLLELEKIAEAIVGNLTEFYHG